MAIAVVMASGCGRDEREAPATAAPSAVLPEESEVEVRKSDVESQMSKVEEGKVEVGLAVKGRGGAVFTVPPQNRTVWANIQWVIGGETNTAYRHLHLFGDGKERRYFFDGAAPVRWNANYPAPNMADKWSGAITSFRVRNDKTKEEIPVRDLRIVADKPALPPELILSHAKSPMKLDCAGRPVDIEVGVFNAGTVAATGVTVRVEGLPAGVRVVNGARNTPPCPSGASPLSEGGERSVRRDGQRQG